MNDRKKAIKISVTIGNEVHALETYENEYRSLMMLINDKLYLDEFGECKGIGRCGTCHVYVLQAPAGMVYHDGNEQTTLSRLPNVKPMSHLACQIMLDASVNGLEVQVVESGW